MNSSTFFVFDDLICCQMNIGWRRFFEGWIAHDWMVAQQAYYSSIKSHRSGKRWTISLITKLWDITWDLWEHRNGILHDRCNVVTEREEWVLNREVSDAFNKLQSALLPINDRHIISLRLACLLKKPKLYKEVWLSNASTIIGNRSNHSSQQNDPRGSLLGMRRCMRQFLR
jgi:hypothetical protein